MSGYHAVLSPSSADRWMLCAAAPAMERLHGSGEDDTNEYSAEGTAAHFLGSECLTQNTTAENFIGSTISVFPDGARWHAHPDALFTFEVDETMAEHVQTYIDAVLAEAGDNTVLVEQAIPIGHITGEEGASGTADAVVIADRELQVHDLKYGYKFVSARDNRQLRLYALGALDEYADLGDFETVRLFIHQPRVSSTPGQWQISVADLEAFREEVKTAALYALTVLNDVPPEQYEEHAVPGEAQCQWCKARASCGKLQAFVTDSVGADFDNLDEAVAQVPKLTPEDLGAKLAATDLIETWIKAVRAKAESELLGGHAVPGFKVVQGRRGARKWEDPATAEAKLKAIRLKRDQMYDLKLISPTKAEKVLADKPRVWKKIEALITQSEGKPHVAPEDDPRPALDLSADADFENLDNADLA